MSIPKKSINTANLILTKLLTDGINVHIYLFTLHHEHAITRTARDTKGRWR